MKRRKGREYFVIVIVIIVIDQTLIAIISVLVEKILMAGSNPK